MVPGTIFLGHSYFPSVSNDFSEKKRDLKSVMDCPFKIVIYNHLVLGHKNPIGNGYEKRRKKISHHKSKEMLLKRSK